MQTLILKKNISLTIFSKKAEAGPPLGTVLGNVGIQATKFSQDFNEFTKDLPEYFNLRVHIFIYEDKSYQYFCHLPTIGYILSIIKKERVGSSGYLEYFITLDDFVMLAKFKFPYMKLEKSSSIVFSVLFSCNIFVETSEYDE